VIGSSVWIALIEFLRLIDTPGRIAWLALSNLYFRNRCWLLLGDVEPLHAVGLVAVLPIADLRMTRMHWSEQQTRDDHSGY
jgi:hypothetical protein